HLFIVDFAIKKIRDGSKQLKIFEESGCSVRRGRRRIVRSEPNYFVTVVSVAGFRGLPRGLGATARLLRVAMDRMKCSSPSAHCPVNARSMRRASSDPVPACRLARWAAWRANGVLPAIQ